MPKWQESPTNGLTGQSPFVEVLIFTFVLVTANALYPTRRNVVMTRIALDRAAVHRAVLQTHHPTARTHQTVTVTATLGVTAAAVAEAAAILTLAATVNLIKYTNLTIFIF